MTTIHTFIFNPFQENTYLIADETGECIIIDPGCYFDEEKSALIDFLKKNEYKLTKIINTHCHVDHILGNAFLVKNYNIPVEASKGDEFLIDNAVEHGKLFGFEVEQPPCITHYLEEPGEIIFGNTLLKVINVPGHSPGHIALFCEKEKFVITGDTLFSGSIGRTDLPGGNYDILMDSITSKILPLGDDVIVYPGHGPSTSIEKEKKTNPFLMY